MSFSDSDIRQGGRSPLGNSMRTRKWSKSQRSRVIIVGPFTPQALELDDSSSSSTGSEVEQFSDRENHTNELAIVRAATPPSSVTSTGHRNQRHRESHNHESMISPEGVFNAIEYERAVYELDESCVVDCSTTSENESKHLVTGVSASQIFGGVEEHRKIVENRIEAELQLLTPVPSISTTAEDPLQRHGKKTELSTIYSDSRAGDIISTPELSISSFSSAKREQTRVKHSKTPASRMDSPPKASERPRAASTDRRRPVAAYTIPQLRSPSPRRVACAGCGRVISSSEAMQVFPCGDLACSRCFGSALSAVSPTQNHTRCPGCLMIFGEFRKAKSSPTLFNTPHTNEGIKRNEYTNDGQEGTIVMRIDNVAWDITPEIVEAFLPPGSLAQDHPQPVHIMLDRYDGRTKDYLFIEVASAEAAKKILQTRQSHFLPGGQLTQGRKRPITITQVHHSELIEELRPASANELSSLLLLCQASINSPPLLNPHLGHSTSYVAPSGLAHFVKSRHGPYFALMSILSKLKMRGSPWWWDLFHIAAGAIAILSDHIHRSTSIYAPPHPRTQPSLDQDLSLLGKLTCLFHLTFTRRGKNLKTVDVKYPEADPRNKTDKPEENIKTMSQHPPSKASKSDTSTSDTSLPGYDGVEEAMSNDEWDRKTI